MLTLPEFFELIEHRVTGGSEFQWQCYGSQAYVIDSDRKANRANYNVSVVFDRDDQVVYEVTVCDYNNRRAYRIINSDFKSGHDDEAAGRGVLANQAWDDILYTDLETVEDFVTKTRAIVIGESYDTRVQLELDLDDDLLFGLMKLAHQQDITLNQLIEQILTEMIDRTRAQKEQTES
jgi:hypothetical protein